MYQNRRETSQRLPGRREIDYPLVDIGWRPPSLKKNHPIFGIPTVASLSRTPPPPRPVPLVPHLHLVAEFPVESTAGGAHEGPKGEAHIGRTHLEKAPSPASQAVGRVAVDPRPSRSMLHISKSFQVWTDHTHRSSRSKSQNERRS